MFPAGATVQLVGARQAATHPVRQAALLGDMVPEVGRRLHRVLRERDMGNTCQPPDANCLFFFFL